MRIALTNLDDMQTADLKTAMSMLKDDLLRMQDAINTTWDVAHNTDGTQKSQFLALQGVTWGTFSQRPQNLTAADDKLQYYVTDYGHHVYWDGSAGVWRFAPGDTGNGFIRPYAIAPQETGWALCDGSTVNYLIVGGVDLTLGSITLPNLKANPAYLKSAAAYTGTINAASGSTAGGSTGTGTTGTGTTGTGTTGTPTAGVAIAHTTTPTTAASGNTSPQLSGFLAGNVIDDGVQTHPIPGLSIPGLSIPALSIPNLGVGTIDMPNLGVLVYFRM